MKIEFFQQIKVLHSLAAPARAVFTTNSTTGFKSLLHEKPVFTFGESDYTSASYSADIHKYRHWEEVIRKHEKSSIIKNFVVTYLNEYSFRYSDPDLKSKLYYFFKKHICGYKKYVCCRSQKSQNKKAILKNVIVQFSRFSFSKYVFNLSSLVLLLLRLLQVL